MARPCKIGSPTWQTCEYGNSLEFMPSICWIVSFTFRKLMNRAPLILTAAAREAKLMKWCIPNIVFTRSGYHCCTRDVFKISKLRLSTIYHWYFCSYISQPDDDEISETHSAERNFVIIEFPGKNLTDTSQ